MITFVVPLQRFGVGFFQQQVTIYMAVVLQATTSLDVKGLVLLILPP